MEEAKHKKLRAAFSCEIESLQSYLRQYAKQDRQKYLASPYVLIIDGRIAGYYTLNPNGIRADDLPNEMLFGLPRYPVYGATLIGRLARDISFRGQGIGAMLLMDALKRVAKNEIVSFAVIVEAINEKAVGFYKKYGFIEYRDDPMRLFMPMSAIHQLLATLGM